MGWILFLLFVAMPIAEIAVLIQVGGIIGTWPTIGIVIFTAFTGAFLAKMEGRAAMQRLAQAVQSGQAPIVQPGRAVASQHGLPSWLGMRRSRR